MAWWIWLIIAIVLVIVQIVTLDLVLLMLAGGALAAGIAAALGVESILMQVLIWAVVSILLLVFVRKWALEKLRFWQSGSETNAASYVGQSGITVTPVDGVSGRVKFNGEVWTARSLSGASIAEGANVVVVQIDGATAVVDPAPGV